MLFSIILPVYNVEKYLQECVESILKQTYKDYEIILVDDGSTDKSPEICDRLSEQNPCVKTVHKKNGGQSDARNAGTKTAQGDYILYIDSDDFIIAKDFLEKLTDKTKNSPDLIFYKYSKYYDTQKRLADCTFSLKSAADKVSYADKIHSLVKDDAFYGMAWIKAIKRAVITDNDIFFDTGLVCEDMDWNYYITLYSQSVEILDEAFIAYRQREGSVTATMKIKNLTDFIYILEKWKDKIERECTDEVLKKALLGSLAKYYSNLFVCYARLGDSRKKEYKDRIKRLDRLFDFAMSKRPQTTAKIYKAFGFDMTVFAIKILDKIKR